MVHKVDSCNGRLVVLLQQFIVVQPSCIMAFLAVQKFLSQNFVCKSVRFMNTGDGQN